MMGVPLRGWDDYPYLLALRDADDLMGFRDAVKGMDATYAEDIWAKPGYLGTERLPLDDLMRQPRTHQRDIVAPMAPDANGKVTGFCVTLPDRSPPMI